MFSSLAVVLGVACVLVVLMDAFETIVLPRTVMRRLRLSNLFFTISGRIYLRLGRMSRGSLRQTLLVAFAPLNLLALIFCWALLMILGWALLHWGLGTPLGKEVATLPIALYFSGVTFFTLGYGDVVPTTALGHTLAVIEAGLGFAFLALVIGYIPVLYTAFSRREVQMLLLDSRAGSDPMGSELLRRHGEAQCLASLPPLLKDWERFSAELLESYLSYPVLAYYRSQHDDQSWLKSLTAVMDACALIETGLESSEPWANELRFQARNTFAMARHVIVDLAYILDVPPIDGELKRLPVGGLEKLRNTLGPYGIHLRPGELAEERFIEVRRMYEPYVQGLAQELVLDLPLWCDPAPHIDNWQISAWEGAKHF